MFGRNSYCTSLWVTLFHFFHGFLRLAWETIYGKLSLRSWRYCKRPRNKVLDKRAAKPRGEWGEGLWNISESLSPFSSKSNLGRFGNLKVLMLQDKNTLQKRSVSHIVVKIASLSCWKVLIVIMAWIVIYLPKRTFQAFPGFAKALGQFEIRQQIKMNATRFMVTNNRLPKSTIKAETVEKKKILKPLSPKLFLRLNYFGLNLLLTL